MNRTIIKYLWLSLGFAFLISLNTYAIRRGPPRPRVVDVHVDPANLDHIFVALFIQDSNDFLVELPLFPAVESHDGGKTFAMAQQRDIPETFIENTLTGSIRYALLSNWRHELWRSDDAGITWKETDLGKFLRNIQLKNSSLWEKRRESNYFSLLPRLRWWKRIFKCVVIIYLLVTSVLIFRRSRFLCIVSLVKSIVVCYMLYIAFTLIHAYNCRIVSLVGLNESIIGCMAGNILRNPSIFVSVLLVLLLFLPNSFTLLRAYLNKNLTKADRIISVWQLGAILLWLFFSLAITLILLMGL